LQFDKRFPIDEKRLLEFRGEMFNCPNHPNFGIPSGLTAFTGVAANGAPVISPTWGLISTTVT
jgi:hypothetical protein